MTSKPASQMAFEAAAAAAIERMHHLLEGCFARTSAAEHSCAGMLATSAGSRASDAHLVAESRRTISESQELLRRVDSGGE